MRVAMSSESPICKGGEFEKVSSRISPVTRKLLNHYSLDNLKVKGQDVHSNLYLPQPVTKTLDRPGS